MSTLQMLITVGLAMLATVASRFIPFLIFREGQKLPRFLEYLGEVLPAALFGMLVVYSLKDTTILSWPYGLPELIAIALVIGLHLWKRQMLLSIFVGTISYMMLLAVLVP